MILAKMKETKEAFLDTKVKHAVANTSAYFSDSQHQTTKDVEPMSQFDLLRIINEPIAER